MSTSMRWTRRRGSASPVVPPTGHSAAANREGSLPGPLRQGQEVNKTFFRKTVPAVAVLFVLFTGCASIEAPDGSAQRYAEILGRMSARTYVHVFAPTATPSSPTNNQQPRFVNYA